MSLDAMDWVWSRSTAKGNARMVLVAIANKCPGLECTAYAGTAMLMRYVNASRTSVRTSIDKLIALGELEIIKDAKGPRGETVYRLPRAVGHSRFAIGASGPGGAGSRSGPDLGPDQELTLRGPESGPEGDRKSCPGGADSGPQNARNQEEHKEQQQPRAIRTAAVVPDELRPLTAALREVGVTVRWNLGHDEGRDVRRLVERHGIEALVARVSSRVGPDDGPKSARYWLKVWGDLDRGPAAGGSNIIPLHSAAARSHRDTLAAGLALLNEQEGLAR